MSRRTMRQLAAENAVLFSKLEEVRDELDDFLSDEDTCEEGDAASANDPDNELDDPSAVEKDD